ncbi:hypothetical protein GCM10007937_24640 [Mesorhizobium albiziae]|nr:hypothetical protein GCM10007937_24640 [Mesorhizobium albiziae]
MRSAQEVEEPFAALGQRPIAEILAVQHGQIEYDKHDPAPVAAAAERTLQQAEMRHAAHVGNKGLAVDHRIGGL